MNTPVEKPGGQRTAHAPLEILKAGAVEQHQTTNLLRGQHGHLQSNLAAHRVTEHIVAVMTEVSHQGDTKVGHLRFAVSQVRVLVR